MNGTEIAISWPDPAQPGARRSVVAGDLIIEGDIASKGPVDIHGMVRGQVRAPEVLVAPSGVVEGTVAAFTLSVQGAVAGEIAARQVSLASTAVVQADVTHDKIAIDSGAQIEGSLRRQPG